MNLTYQLALPAFPLPLSLASVLCFVPALRSFYVNSFRILIFVAHRHNSFRFHTYEKVLIFPLLTPLQSISSSLCKNAKPRRMNTSVLSIRKSCRIRTYEKTGEGVWSYC